MNWKKFAGRFLIGALTVFVSVLLQLRLGFTVGWYPNVALAALIAVSFFFEFLEIVAISLLAVLCLRWSPAIGFELMVFGFAPVVLFLFRKIIFPFQNWLSNTAAVVIGVFVLYGISNPSFLLHEPKTVFVDVVFATLYGLLVFSLLRFVRREDVHGA